MSDRLDEVARMMAADEAVPRRAALRGVATLLGGGLLGVIGGRGPAAAKAAPPVRCQPGTTLCGTVCRDTSVNPDHCGACGSACGPGQMCRNGTCVGCICEPACPPGEIRCTGVCVNTQNSPANCGTCGNACPPGQSCAAGVCGQCPGAMCDGRCTDLSTDYNNCGACGNVCQPAPNSIEACVGGQCVSTGCVPGFFDCDPNVPGCETTLSTPDQCGACGVVCPTGASCVDRTCVCPPGTQACQDRCTTLGQGCDTGRPGICAAGTTQCVDNLITCVPHNEPRPEICNGLDDDCDGTIDEGNPGGGEPCNTGLPGACAGGVTNCVGGALVCTPPAGC